MKRAHEFCWRRFGFVFLLAIVGSPTQLNCSSQLPPVTGVNRPYIHLLGERGAMAATFGQTADGEIFGGPGLSSWLGPEVTGALSITTGIGVGSGSVSYTSPLTADFWTCAALASGNVMCVAEDNGNELPGIATQMCTDSVQIPPGRSTVCTSSNMDGCSVVCVPQWTVLPNFVNVVQVSDSCTVSASGAVQCWAGFEPPSLPGPVQRLGGAFAILTNGDLYSLVDGAQVPLSNVINVASSDATDACAVTSDSSLYCWGDNTLGQVGNGSAVTAPSPVMVGTGYRDVVKDPVVSCGLTAQGTVNCWGAVGPGSAACECTTTPAPIVGLSNVVELGAIGGAQFPSALDVLIGDGSVVAIVFPTSLTGTVSLMTVHPIN